MSGAGENMSRSPYFVGLSSDNIDGCGSRVLGRVLGVRDKAGVPVLLFSLPDTDNASRSMFTGVWGRMECDASLAAVPDSEASCTSSAMEDSGEGECEALHVDWLDWAG